MASAPRRRLPPPHPVKADKRRQQQDISGKASRPLLKSFKDMPEWFQRENNRWILHGYRPISGSMQISFRSWSYLHNETVNIYTHLIPAILFIPCTWLLQRYLLARNPDTTSADLVAFSIFTLAAATCLSLSATYHTLMNHSQHVEHLCLRLDMLGVVVFILGDLVLGIYIIFWCDPILRTFYWSMIGAFGTMTILMTMHPRFQGSKYRVFRAMMFVATGLSGIAPLIHGFYAFGLSTMMEKALPHTLMKAGFLLSGTLFYATRFPERQYPGKFDVCGSHSIFHVLVVCAAVVQLAGYLKAFDLAVPRHMCMHA